MVLTSNLLTQIARKDRDHHGDKKISVHALLEKLQRQVARAARNLEPLLAAESECATVVDGSVESRRPVREVGTGTLVQVRSGERIPLDGTVMEGESHADEAVITGESRLVPKGVGSPVIAGSINMDGPLLIRSTRAGTDTRWAQICRSVRDALTRRSPTQRLADRVVGIFVPLVLTLGALTTLCWAQSLPFDRALLIGLAVLVIACPCAVGLAAPLATSLGIGRLARRGCLVREPGALEDLARTRLLALDKTGTLTSGRPHVVRIETDEVVADQVLGPSYTLDVARAVWRVIESGHTGLCHVSSAGETSWHDFAREIFRLEGLTPALTPVSSDEYGARAKRPRYSVLAHDTLTALGIAEPRAWNAALAAYLAERRAVSAPARPGS